jgi:GAF domain-containing protein
MESAVPVRAIVAERICAGVALVLGALCLIGSGVDAPRLGQWFGNLPGTAAITAVTACLVAGAHLVRARWSRVAAVASGTAFALVASGLVTRMGHLHHPLADWWRHSVAGLSGPGAVPSFTTAFGLAGWSAGLLLVTLRRPRVAQVVAAVPAVIGGLAILSFVYGDRLSIIRRSSFPNTATSVPISYCFLLGALAVLTATPDVGVSAWITRDSTGRRVVRSLVPVVVGLPLVLAGIARWTGLADSVGDARAWALVMSAITVGIFGIATFAVGFIDRLSDSSQRAELTEVRLDNALRAAAVAHLAQDLAASVTAEEVAAVVNQGVCQVLGASLASFGIIDRNAGVVRMQHGLAIDDAVAARFAHPPLDANLVISDAARTGRAVFVADYDDYQRRYPRSDASAGAFGSGGRAALPLQGRSGETFGALVVSWPDPVVFEDTMRATLATIGPLVAQSLERARVTDDLAESATRNARLADLSEALAVAGGAQDVIRVMCERIAAPIGAVEAIVGVMDPPGEQLLCSVTAPGSGELLAFVDPMDSSRPMVQTARTGEVLFFANRDAVAAGNPEGLDRFDVRGLGAAACVPLRNRDGQLFGSFGVGWDHPVALDPQMATLLSTIAELSAQTLQRAWLADERGRDAARARRLATFAEALAVASTSAQVADVVAAHVADTFGAESAQIIMDGADPGGTVEWPAVTSVTIPIMTARGGRAQGWLCVRWPAAVPTDDTTAATLLTITELISQTIDRAYLAEAEHRLVEDLQRRTLHPLPELDGFDVAARYQPAAAELGMGGDWFEVVELADGSIGLIVGDVVGHGVEAAAEMSQVSGVLATLVRVGTPLDQLLARVHEAVRVTSPRFLATAVVVVVDRETGTMQYVSAGHPPVMVIALDGTVTRLGDGRQPVVGMPPGDVVPGRSTLEVGSTLFAYTDGLIERRGEDLTDGLSRLAGIVAASASRPAEAQVAAAVAGCTDGRVIEDDIAVVALRRVGG